MKFLTVSSMWCITSLDVSLIIFLSNVTTGIQIIKYPHLLFYFGNYLKQWLQAQERRQWWTPSSCAPPPLLPQNQKRPRTCQRYYVITRARRSSSISEDYQRTLNPFEDLWHRGFQHSRPRHRPGYRTARTCKSNVEYWTLCRVIAYISPGPYIYGPGDSDDFINILISNQTSHKIAYLLNQLI